jgi:hypothetical protein
MRALQKRKLKERNMYAITTGERVGGFVVYIKECNIDEDNLAFLFMPDPMESLFFTKNEVEHNLKDGTLVLVEKLPKNVYDVCRANFEFYAKKTGNDYYEKSDN